MTPQEKKHLSLMKDCRNTYGENDKSSRKAIRFRKRWVNRTFRRRVNELIESTPTDDIDSNVGGVQRKEWKKCADMPLGEKMLREGNWNMERRIREAAQTDPGFPGELEDFLTAAVLSKPRIRVVVRRVRAIALDKGSSKLDLGSEDLALLGRFLDKQTSREQNPKGALTSSSVFDDLPQLQRQTGPPLMSGISSRPPAI